MLIKYPGLSIETLNDNEFVVAGGHGDVTMKENKGDISVITNNMSLVCTAGLPELVISIIIYKDVIVMCGNGVLLFAIYCDSTVKIKCILEIVFTSVTQKKNKLYVLNRTKSFTKLKMIRKKEASCLDAPERRITEMKKKVLYRDNQFVLHREKHISLDKKTYIWGIFFPRNKSVLVKKYKGVLGFRYRNKIWSLPDPDALLKHVSYSRETRLVSFVYETRKNSETCTYIEFVGKDFHKKHVLDANVISAKSQGKYTICILSNDTIQLFAGDKFYKTIRCRRMGITDVAVVKGFLVATSYHKNVLRFPIDDTSIFLKVFKILLLIMVAVLICRSKNMETPK